MTLEELNMIREWFNVVADVSPEYLEVADRDLMEKITGTIENFENQLLEEGK